MGQCLRFYLSILIKQKWKRDVERRKKRKRIEEEERIQRKCETEAERKHREQKKDTENYRLIFFCKNIAFISVLQKMETEAEAVRYRIIFKS